MSSGPGRRALITEYGATHVLYHSLPPWFKNILHEEFDFEVFSSMKRLMHRIEMMEGTQLVFENIVNAEWDFDVLVDIIKSNDCYYFTKRFGYSLSQCMFPY